jgi:MoaA/NifB/PqqE/SkfB family radical SAM enzyme
MRFKREVVHNYPVAAFIEPNLFCNLQCPACPTGLRLGLRPTVSIKEELFKAAIDEIGDYVFQLYMYNWGEPLLHKQTPELIRYAKAKDLKIVLSTNLSIKLTDDYIERLVQSGLDRLIVSLDGLTQETYEKYRRGGKLDLVRENVMRIKQAKERLGVSTPKVVWQFLVFKHNEHEIEQARAEFKDWGADEITIGAAEMPAEEHSKGLEPSTLPQYNLYHPDHPVPREAERQMNSGRACSWLYGVFVLNPNGRVSPCCSVSSEKLDFGEYKSGAFFDLWNNEKFRRARGLFAKSTSRPAEPMSLDRKLAITKRQDGMGSRDAQSFPEKKIICQKCPIPHLQDYIDPIIGEVAYNMAHPSGVDFKKRARHWFNYLLMGAPNFREQRRSILDRAFASLRYRLAN